MLPGKALEAGPLRWGSVYVSSRWKQLWPISGVIGSQVIAPVNTAIVPGVILQEAVTGADTSPRSGDRERMGSYSDLADGDIDGDSAVCLHARLPV